MFGLYDVHSAVRLAAWLMVGVVGVFLLERLLRGRRSYSSSTSKARALVLKKLTGWRAGAAWTVCMLVFAVAFLIPFAQLIVWATWTYRDVLTPGFWQLISNTMGVAVAATLIIMLLATITANVSRFHRNAFGYALSKAVTAGYSIPGAIIAIGVLALFIGLDERLAPVYAALGLGEGTLVLSMSLIMLVVAYVVRFMATGYQAMETGYDKLGAKYSEASRLLGQGMTKTFFKVELPLLKGAMLSGLILTMVEIIKELPLALLLRPFNFETLATKTYQYASDEQIYEAAVPSLIIILVSMLSVIVIQRLGRKEQ